MDNAFAKANLAKALLAPGYLLGELATRAIPRSSDEWVVGSAFGVSDGARAVVVELMTRPSPPRVTWLARSAAEAEEAAALGVDVLPHGSLKAFLRSTRAGVLLVTHGFGDASRFATRGAFVVQLWHGAPLKRLHADSDAVMSLPLLGSRPGAQRAIRSLYLRGGRRIGLIPVGSHFVQPLLASGLGVNPASVQVLGEPRTDVLFAGDPVQRRDVARDVISSSVGDVGSRRVVLFAPTWRDGMEDPVIPTPEEWALIESRLAYEDGILLVRPHPLSVGDYRHSSERVRLLTSQMAPDVNPMLPGLDAVITDYSSILVDAAVVGVPIVFLAPDEREYTASRGLYVPYAETSGGHVERTWLQAMTRLHEVLAPGRTRDSALAHCRSLADRYHEHRDAASSRRVVDQVLERTQRLGSSEASASG